jgi:hypothetical protein
MRRRSHRRCNPAVDRSCRRPSWRPRVSTSPLQRSCGSRRVHHRAGAAVVVGRDDVGAVGDCECDVPRRRVVDRDCRIGLLEEATLVPRLRGEVQRERRLRVLKPTMDVAVGHLHLRRRIGRRPLLVLVGVRRREAGIGAVRRHEHPVRLARATHKLRIQLVTSAPTPCWPTRRSQLIRQQRSSRGDAHLRADERDVRRGRC